MQIFLDHVGQSPEVGRMWSQSSEVWCVGPYGHMWGVGCPYGHRWGAGFVFAARCGVFIVGLCAQRWGAGHIYGHKLGVRWSR